MNENHFAIYFGSQLLILSVFCSKQPPYSLFSRFFIFTVLGVIASNFITSIYYLFKNLAKNNEMNQSERRFFLKRFFSFNASTISTDSVSLDDPTLTSSTSTPAPLKTNTISTDIDETNRDEQSAKTLSVQDVKKSSLSKETPIDAI